MPTLRHRRHRSLLLSAGRLRSVIRASTPQAWRHRVW